MIRKTTVLGGLGKLALALVMAGARFSFAGTTNDVPWADSFETYSNGFQVSGTNGWQALGAGESRVTADSVLLQQLADYATEGKSYPLPDESHDRVLQTVDEILNHTHSVSGGVVTVDFMAQAIPVNGVPYIDPWLHYAFVVSSNGHLRLWHRNTTSGGTGVNEWLELNGATLQTGQWARFTVQQDYTTHRYQVRVNGGEPLTHSAGWTLDGATTNGSWFNMVRTNGVMSGFSLGNSGTNYVDDMVVDRRHLGWSTNALVESVVNDGTIDNTPALSITLTRDGFDASNGEDLVVSGKVYVEGLPSNLVAVVTATSATEAVLTVTGAALAHELTDSVNVTVQFTNSAFQMGNAWDVVGSMTSLSMSFSDTPSLSYTMPTYLEAGANNGSIDNSMPMVVFLTNGAFTALGSLTNAVAFTGLPLGLTGHVERVSDTQVAITLLGQAALHAASNSVGSVDIAFGNGAFVTVPASSVFHSSTNFSVSFADPSIVVFGTNVISETIVNNGALGSVDISLVNKTFNATNGEDLVANGKVVVANLPDGLGVQLVRGESDDVATLIFTGTALSNGVAASIANLQVTFTDAAFVGGQASTVENYSIGNLRIQFMDPRVAMISATEFREVSGGVIDNRNPLTITLSGETFTGTNNENFAATGKITQNGLLPAGLALEATRDSAARLSLRLTGRAFDHAAEDSVSNVVFTLQSSAFSLGNATYVENYQMTNIKVIFTNDTGYFNVMPYEEPFEGYANGFWLEGTNGWQSIEPGAGTVTNVNGVNTSLEVYRQAHYYGLPIVASHTNTLRVEDSVEVAIHSEAAPLACLDFMALPVPVAFPAGNDTNLQYAFFVNTNANLVIWHRNTTGTEPVNEWLTLTNTVSTSQWVRFTVVQDYANSLFQIRMNEDRPVDSAVGWTDGGLVQTGSWFRMVQTNGTMTRFKVSGFGPGYVDDLTLRTVLPGFARSPGTVYLMR